MGDQLKSLYLAINYLGEGKKQADKKQFDLDEVMKKFDAVAFEKSIHDSEIQAVSESY